MRLAISASLGPFASGPSPPSADVRRGDHVRRDPTVAAEAPGQGQCLKSDVAMYADGVGNLLRFKGILPGPAPKATSGDARPPVGTVAAARRYLY